VTRQFEIKNLIEIRVGIDRHNERCPIPPEAILMNPVDYKLMDHPRLWGFPVVPDSSVPTKRCRIQCEGSAEEIEAELDMHQTDP
jgi:hypothetical protein